MPTFTVKIAAGGTTIDSNGSSLARRKRLSIICLLLMILSGCAVLNPTIPIEIPIDLSKAGSVAEAEIWLPTDDRIELTLYFFVNDQPGDGKRLFEVLDPNNKFGITTPLKIQIKKQITPENDELWLDKIYPTTNPGGTGKHYYYRNIVSLSMKSGTYRLRVKNIKPFHQLVQNRVELRVYYVRAPK